MVALLWAAKGLSQPLWVDELHSNWVIVDGWPELLARARQGNQTPTYFAALKCLSWIFQTQPDWLIRLPSILAWSVAVASLTWMLLRGGSQSNGSALIKQSLIGQAAVILWCSCVLLDAWQYFYAVEARVYGIVQLLNLWAWFAVLRLAIRNSQASKWLWLAWTVLACALLHLHITSGLGVVCQSAVLVLVAVGAGRDRAYCLTSLTFVGINAAWLLYDSQAVWQRRQQWAKFAGDGSLGSLTEVFPFVPLLLPVVAGWLIARGIEWLRSGNTQISKSQIDAKSQNSNWHNVCLWGIAAFGPCLLAWLLTRYDIAPMFHYRFVIVSALPLYLFAGWWLLQQSSAMRCLTVLVVFCWMSLSDGPLAAVQQGRWQNERQEDWRSASEFVGQRFKQSQSLWCYAGLIEGVGLELPLAGAMDEYLSYPLRGSYRLSANMPVTPHGLVADRKLWLQQIRQNSTTANKQSDFPAEIWIIYRGLAERLSSDLQTASMHNFAQLVPLRQFGRISVVCIKID